MLPGPADRSLLRGVIDSIGLGIRERDDVIVVPPILLHSCIEDTSGARAGGEPGAADP